MIKIFSIVVVATVFIAGCAGTDFQKLGINKLVFGSDTPETIKQKLGKPYSEGTFIKNENQFKTMDYAYASLGGATAYKGVIAARIQKFYFFQNKLVGHEFTSSWAIDSTDFDDSKFSEIIEGTTTLQEAIELIGRPSGEYVYPLVENENEKAKVYLYNQTKRSSGRLEIHQKLLVVTHDENSIVTNVEYVSSGEKPEYVSSGEKSRDNQLYSEKVGTQSSVNLGHGLDSPSMTPNKSLTGSYISKITGVTRALNIKGRNPEVRLIQNGKKISGTFGSKGGMIWGEVEDGTITFKFQSSDGNAGRGVWTVKPESDEIIGKWSANWVGEGEWNLTRIE